MKKLTFFIVLLFLAVSLFNCGGDDAATEEDTELEEEVLEDETMDMDEDEGIEAEETSAPTLVTVAQGNENLSTLVQALTAADLVDALNGEGPFTVFAPTNAAFEALGPKLQELLQPENKEELASILKYHVIQGAELMSSQLEDGQSAATLNGADLSISTTDGVKVNDNATVVTPDVDASNGVVHVIDQVIMPPAN